MCSGAIAASLSRKGGSWCCGLEEWTRCASKTFALRRHRGWCSATAARKESNACSSTSVARSPRLRPLRARCRRAFGRKRLFGSKCRAKASTVCSKLRWVAVVGERWQTSNNRTAPGSPSKNALYRLMQPALVLLLAVVLLLIPQKCRTSSLGSIFTPMNRCLWRPVWAIVGQWQTCASPSSASPATSETVARASLRGAPTACLRGGLRKTPQGSTLGSRRREDGKPAAPPAGSSFASTTSCSWGLLRHQFLLPLLLQRTMSQQLLLLGCRHLHHSHHRPVCRLDPRRPLQQGIHHAKSLLLNRLYTLHRHLHSVVCQRLPTWLPQILLRQYYRHCHPMKTKTR